MKWQRENKPREPGRPDMTVADLDAIRAWVGPIAAGVEVWLFGSRAKGTSRPDSDVDIGIVLAPRSDDGTDWSLGTYTARGDEWQAQLAAVLGRHVSLEAIGTGADMATVSGGRAVRLWRRSNPDRQEASAIAKGDADPATYRVHVPSDLDVAAIRKGLRMSQSEFARVFGFPVGTVREWEQGRSRPDTSARAYLLVISRDPDSVRRALAGPVADAAE